MERLRPLAVAAELAGQGLIHVELRGYGAAAVEVQVVLAAQLAVLAQGRLAGRALLFEVTASRKRQGLKSGGVMQIENKDWAVQL